MIERAGDAGDEFRVAGHALGLRAPGHPRLQAGAQQPEVVAHELRRVRRRHRIGVHCAHDRVAVVLVEPGPGAGLDGAAQAFGDARQRLRMAAQRAGQRAVETQPALAQVLAQPHALAVAEFAELVVVGGAEGRLAVADEEERAHAPDCRRWPRQPMSRGRPGWRPRLA